MKRTFALFIAYVTVIATGLAVYTAIGLARNGDDPAAGAAVAAFGSALDSGDGGRACSLLTEDAQDAVEQSRRKSCEAGVLELRRLISPAGTPAEANRAESSALVRMSGGGTWFLDETRDGWRVSAAGCEANPGLPYECEVEG